MHVSSLSSLHQLPSNSTNDDDDDSDFLLPLTDFWKAENQQLHHLRPKERGKNNVSIFNDVWDMWKIHIFNVVRVLPSSDDICNSLSLDFISAVYADPFSDKRILRLGGGIKSAPKSAPSATNSEPYIAYLSRISYFNKSQERLIHKYREI